MTDIAAVIGHPVGHSLSPVIHEFWLKEKKIAGEYRKHDVSPSELRDTVLRMRVEGYAGLNVTLPHKEAVVDLCDELSDAAHAIGAVNTLVFANKKIYGDNTDAEGFAENLQAVVGEQEFHTATIIGAGGAARAVVFALMQLGVQDFVVMNRDLARAEKLLTDLHANGRAAALDAPLAKTDILVNCTSLGMKGQPPLNPNLSPLGKNTVVADIVYQPLQTPLLAQASRRGHRVVDGLGMLMEQAAAAFEQFYGAEAGSMVKLRELLEQRLG